MRTSFSPILLALTWLLFSQSLTVYADEDYSAKTLRIDTQTLSQQLNLTGQVILDTRSEQDYQKGHIQGALNFPVAWTYHQKSTDGKIIQPKVMQQRLRELGIDTLTKVVVYDDGQLVDAARLFWTLEVYGIHHVQVLDQGFDNWQAQKLPTSQVTPKVPSSQYVASINHQRLANKLTTLIGSQNPNQIVVDARKLEAYLGQVSAAKRFGHIPNAISIPASHNIDLSDKHAQLQPVDTLKAVYSELPKHSKIITYCAIGRISASNYLALRELGYDVANYDGSWKEWGNDFNLPVTNPAGEQP